MLVHVRYMESHRDHGTIEDRRQPKSTAKRHTRTVPEPIIRLVYFVCQIV
jgi:hypothetical protein